MTRLTCEDTYLVKNRNLNNGYYSLIFGPYSRAHAYKPGQFVHIRLSKANIFFRRAFSVAHVRSASEVEVIVKAVGRGTTLIAQLRNSDPVNLLGPLGVPFKLPQKTETPVVVAGGIGFPPVLFLVCETIRKGCDPKRIVFFYGGRSHNDIVERSRIKKLGVDFRPVTEDGSLGEAGLVTEAVQKYIQERQTERLRIFSCGPLGMLKEINRLGLKYGIPGQFSLEAPMPCGIGICLGCVVELTRGGYARACCDGPVFNIGEVRL